MSLSLSVFASIPASVSSHLNFSTYLCYDWQLDFGHPLVLGISFSVCKFFSARYILQCYVQPSAPGTSYSTLYILLCYNHPLMYVNPSVLGTYFIDWYILKWWINHIVPGISFNARSCSIYSFEWFCFDAFWEGFNINFWLFQELHWLVI